MLPAGGCEGLDTRLGGALGCAAFGFSTRLRSVGGSLGPFGSSGHVLKMKHDMARLKGECVSRPLIRLPRHQHGRRSLGDGGEPLSQTCSWNGFGALGSYGITKRTGDM